MRLILGVGLAVLMTCGGPVALAANHVEVESKTVSPGANGVTVGVFIENQVDVEALQVPLEVREVDAGSYISGSLDVTVQGRVAASDLMNLPILQYYPTPAAQFCSGPISNSYMDVAPIDFVSPDALVWAGFGMGGCMEWGGDGDTPSLVLTFDVTGVQGIFEIDTCCLGPGGNHLLFVECITQAYITPTFTAGTIEIAENACPIIEGFEQDQVVVMTGDHVINMIHAEDPEGDPIEYYLVYGPGMVDAMTGEWMYDAICADIGSNEVRIGATDRGIGECDEWSFVLHVVSSPLEPYCTDLTVTCGEVAEQMITVIGGCPPYTFTQYSGPGLIDSPGHWFWQTTCEDVGHHVVEIEVSDAHQATSCAFTVEVTPQNSPPVLNVIGDQSIAEGELLSFEVSGSDPDGDPLQFYSASLPHSAAHVAVLDSFFWMPNFDQAGVYPEVAFYVTDGEFTDSQKITITVENTNRPPVCGNGQASVSYEGDSVVIQLLAADPDGDPVDYAVGALPPGAVYDPSTAQIRWLPGYYQAGRYAVLFTATDTAGAATQQEIRLVVEESPVGDLTCDGMVNVLDVVKLIDTVFRSSGGLCCLPGAADFRPDGFLNILDVVLQVDFAFRGGEELTLAPHPVMLMPRGGETASNTIFVEAVNLSDRDGVDDTVFIEWSTDSATWSPANVAPYGAAASMSPYDLTHLSFVLLPDLEYEGPLYVRMTVVDTVHGGVGTSEEVPGITVIMDPIVEVQAYYDEESGVLCWDGRATVASSLGGALDFDWGTDVDEELLFGPVVQVFAPPLDSVALQVRAEHRASSYIYGILDAITETFAECLIVIKLNCECESLTMLPGAPGAGGSVGIFDPIFWTILQAGLVPGREMVGWGLFGPEINLGGNPAPGWAFAAPGPRRLSYNFVVHGVMRGNPLLCQWGQRVRATGRVGPNIFDTATPAGAPGQNGRYRRRGAMPAGWIPHPAEFGPNAGPPPAANSWAEDDYRGPGVPAGAGFANSPHVTGVYPLPGWNRWGVSWYDAPGAVRRRGPWVLPTHYHATFKDYICGFLGGDCTQKFQVEIQLDAAPGGGTVTLGPQMVPGSYSNPVVGADAGCP